MMGSMKNNPDIELVVAPSVLDGGTLGRLVRTPSGGAKIETFSEVSKSWVAGGASFADFLPGKARLAEPSDFESVGLDFPDFPSA